MPNHPTIIPNVLIAPELAGLTNLFAPSPTKVKTTVEPPFFLPEPEETNRNGPFLGWVRKYGKNLYPTNLGLSDLLAHVAIFGMTGSGKSTTAMTIVSRLAKLDVNVLIIDWHSEYRRVVLSNGGMAFAPGKDISPLTINPFDPPSSGDLSEHISLVTDIFSDAFGFSSAQSFMFREALTSAYQKMGYYSSRPSTPPTISTLIREIEHKPIRSRYDNETKIALNRKLKPLTEGQAGKALNGQSTISVKELLTHLVSIELGHFKEQEIRKIFASILLKLVYDFRVERPCLKLEHVTVIEEARNVMPTRLITEPPSIGERMISELRKFGEGVIIVSQFPTQVSQEILKNTSTCICHQIKTEDDRRILQGALRLTDEQTIFLHYLKPGEAIISLPSIDHAFFIYVEPEHYKPVTEILDQRLKTSRHEEYLGFHKVVEPVPVNHQSSSIKHINTGNILELFKRHGELTLGQLTQKIKVPTLEFYSIIYPHILRLMKERKIEEIRKGIPANYIYRFRGHRED